MDQRRGDRGRHSVAHRPGRRPEERAGLAEPESTTGPAGEVAGVGGEDRVVGQDVAQRRDRRARDGRRARSRHPRRRRRSWRPPRRRGRRCCVAWRRATSAASSTALPSKPLVGGTQEGARVGGDGQGRQAAGRRFAQARGRRAPSASSADGIESSYEVGSFRRQPITSIASAAASRSRTDAAAPKPAIPR